MSSDFRHRQLRSDQRLRFGEDLAWPARTIFGAGRSARSRSPRRSTTAPTGRRRTACSASASSVRRRDWECACGKYKGTKYKGIICDRCGVKVTHSRVRRKRMGHINLAAPVVHIWFFKAMPSRLGTLLGMKTDDLEKVIYFQDYVVTDPGDTPLEAAAASDRRRISRGPRAVRRTRSRPRWAPRRSGSCCSSSTWCSCPRAARRARQDRLEAEDQGPDQAAEDRRGDPRTATTSRSGWCWT